MLAALDLPAATAAVTPDSRVIEMLEGVSREELEPVVADLSGATPATIGGAEYSFTTRSSSSGVPIDMAEQYVFEQLSSYGLDSVVYHEFPPESGAPPGRNVIGQIDGTTRADEIVVLGAHMDSYPWNGAAPGADDDASGVSATLYVARSFAGHSFERTIRFAFFGDEENAPWVCDEIGSAGYAARCADAGEDIVAMIQADAIAYDPPESEARIGELVTRRPSNDPGGGDQAIAELWLELIEAYGIAGIEPQHVPSGNNWSDHGSFWNQGYPAALLVAEERDHWNPNWHSADDLVSTFTWPLYVPLTQSYLALAAHLAVIEALPEDTGSRDSDSGPETNDTGTPGHEGGCGCVAPGAWPPLALLTLLGLWLTGRRRAAPARRLSAQRP